MSRFYLLQSKDKLRPAPMNFLALLFVFNLVAGLFPVAAQQAIELNQNSYPGSIPNGPTIASQTVSFRQNTTGSTFVNLSNPVTVTASFANQAYILPPGAPAGMMFGGTLFGATSVNVFPNAVFTPLNAKGSPSSSSYTSNPYGTAGTGIDVATNHAFEIFNTLSMWFGTTGPVGKRAFYGDITFTFSRPVSDPVIHLGDLGATNGSNGSSAEFELPAGSGLTLTKLSGTSELTVPATNDKILNSSSSLAAGCGNGAACGSVRINGTNITSVTFKVYTRFTNTSFASVGSDVTGEAFTVGFSFAAFNLSGTVYDDANGATDNTVNGTVTNAGGSLYALAIDAFGKVQGSTLVAAVGTFSFTNLVKASYTVRLSTTPGTLGATAPATSIPANWLHTGEFKGTGAGTDGTVDGNVAGSINTSDVTDFKLGIERAPTANNITYELTSLPLINSIVALDGAIGSPTTGNAPIRPNGTDPEDGQLSAGKNIVINTLPLTGTLKYNNILVVAGQSIVNFDPGLLTVQFTGTGYNSVSFTYSYKDAATVASAPATYTIIFPNGSLLPVTLTSFTATVADNSNDVLLKWQTAIELNNRRFVIQHSRDGRDWEAIGFVDGAGNSNGIIDYDYVHHGVGKGVHYYRLQQEDFDGHSELSHIRQVNMDGKDVIQVYPNPAANVLHIVSGQKELKEVSVLNITGSRILSQRISQRQYSLDISRIPAGTYLLLCQYRDGTVVYEKIIKR